MVQFSVSNFLLCRDLTQSLTRCYTINYIFNYFLRKLYVSVYLNQGLCWYISQSLFRSSSGLCQVSLFITAQFAEALPREVRRPRFFYISTLKIHVRREPRNNKSWSWALWYCGGVNRCQGATCGWANTHKSHGLGEKNSRADSTRNCTCLLHSPGAEFLHPKRNAYF